MEVIIATSQSRLETHSVCLVIESCDYESILSSLFSFVFHITSIREIAATQTMTITFQASTLAWKEMPFLLVAFKFATSPRCTPGMGAVRMVGCCAKCFTYMISSPHRSPTKYVFPLSTKGGSKRFTNS